jgi:hypothetical protein
MEQALKVLYNSLKQKDEQIEIHSQKLKQLSSERGEMIKMIESLTKIINVETPTTTEEPTKKTLNEQQSFSSTSSAGSMPEEDMKKSWAEKVEQEDEESKNGLDQPSDAVDLQPEKKVYVIFDGPMKGIYNNWAIASLHINGKNVRHKAYPTMEKAKEAYKASYKEMTIAKEIGQPSKMESKKKISVGSIINLQKEKNKPKTLDDFMGKWRWLANFKEELALECFYPVNTTHGVKANTVPGISKELIKEFYDYGMLKTVYLEEGEGRRFQELADLPKEIGDTAKRFNDFLAKGREIYLQFEQTYPWFFEENNFMAVKPRTVIKIGISNKTYLPPNSESVGWTVDSFIYQMKRFYDNLIRYGSTIINYKVLYTTETCLMVCDSKKKVSEEHLKQTLFYEELFSRFENALDKVPDEVQQECCQHFSKYKGHICKWCAKKKVSVEEDKVPTITDKAKEKA